MTLNRVKRHCLKYGVGVSKANTIQCSCGSAGHVSVTVNVSVTKPAAKLVIEIFLRSNIEIIYRVRLSIGLKENNDDAVCCLFAGAVQGIMQGGCLMDGLATAKDDWNVSILESVRRGGLVVRLLALKTMPTGVCTVRKT